MSTGLTDEQLAVIDVAAAIRSGLGSPLEQRRLFAEGAVAAAVQADRVAIEAPALAFLAEIVRRGGIACATGLPEPLPVAAQAELVRSWLEAAADADDILVARWLDAVAILIGSKQVARISSR